MTEYLLHEEVWMPDCVKNTAKNMQKLLDIDNFSEHLYNHLAFTDTKHNYCEGDIIRTIKKIVANPISPFEVKVVEDDNKKCKIVKYCVRTSLNDTTDISIVVGGGQKIVTAWLNDKNDKHYTLNKSRYYRPKQ